MPSPVFADIDKSPSDLLNDDFDSKFTLKIKSQGPFGVTVTTNTAYSTKDNKLSAKVSGKWAHVNGFTLEKFEVSPDGKITTETSLSGAAPGLKLEFKGNDSDKGDLSFTYSIANATVAGEFDALTFSKASTSVAFGHGDITAGASADLKIAKASVDSASFALGVGYKGPQFFVGLTTLKNFTEHKGIFSWTASNRLTVLGLLNYTAKGGAAPTLGAVYKCAPNTTVKAKAALSSGLVNFSYKQSFEKKFAVVTSLEVPASFASYKLGVNATLG